MKTKDSINLLLSFSLLGKGFSLGRDHKRKSIKNTKAKGQVHVQDSVICTIFMHGNHHCNIKIKYDKKKG